MSDAWPWLALALLGAYHGLNPAMGWLFAVALGLQERRLSAVLQALVPIAFGHELAVGTVVVLVRSVEFLASPWVRAGGAVVLVVFGIYKLVRPRSHPRWVGMRVSAADLVLWSFLMSSAHGAGLMLFPLLLGLPVPAEGEGIESQVLTLVGSGGASALRDLAAVLLHTLAMLVVMGGLAVLVYAKLGVMVLRRAWINLDALWAGALILAGLATLFT